MKNVKANSASRAERQSIRCLAQNFGPDAFNRLVELLDSKDERLVLAVAQEILNRAYGKPESGRDGRDEEGGPTVVVIRDGQNETGAGRRTRESKAAVKLLDAGGGTSPRRSSAKRTATEAQAG